MKLQRYYENLNILHDRTEPHRAYYIPASKRMDELVLHREHSDRMQLLSGIWKFRFYESIYDLKNEFWAEDFDRSGFGDISVPGVWQNFGFDTHQYTNIRYPFPFDPPYVLQDNPCGAYVTEFQYNRDEKAPRAYLNFEGVDSCFYVWLNGAKTSEDTNVSDFTDSVLKKFVSNKPNFIFPFSTVPDVKISYGDIIKLYKLA